MGLDLERTWCDVAHSARSIRGRPALALSVIATLALGLGVNAATFSFLDSVFLRSPGGIVQPSALRRFWSLSKNAKGESVAYELRAGIDELHAVAAAVGGAATLAAHATQPNVHVGDAMSARTISVVRASANYLPLLGVRAAQGRLFDESEASITAPAPVAVISDALWHSEFNAERSAIGSAVVLAGVRFTVIGVMAPDFAGIDLERVDAWVPLGMAPLGMSGDMRSMGSRPRYLALLARLAPGVNDDVLGSRATTIIRQAAAADAADAGADSSERVALGPIIQNRGPGKESAEIRIAERLGAVSVAVLLIACANIINLLLAQAMERRRDVAIRVALGITRARLIVLLSLPTVMLAGIAGIAAAVSARFTGQVLRSRLLPDVHFAAVGVSWRLMGAIVGASLVVGIGASLIPALASSRPNVVAVLKAGTQSGGFGRSRVRSALVALQTALSVVLLVGAALFLRSVRNIEGVRLGYDVEHLAAMHVMYDDWRAPDSAALVTVAARLRTIPGVEGVSLIGDTPLAGGTWASTVFTARDSTRGESATWPTLSVVSANYFSTTGIRVVRGRAFTDDRSWSIVVNEEFVRQFWPSENPIGQCVRVGKRSNQCYTVIGVAEDAHQARVVEQRRAHFYLPVAHPPGPGMRAFALLVRAAPHDWAGVTPAARRALVQAFPGARPRIEPLELAIAPAYRPFRLGAALFSMFGALALAVAALGIYSTLSYSVAQRRREFGVRVAIGAQLADVMGLVLSDGMRPVLLGALGGVSIAVAARTFIASMLYDVSPTDPFAVLAAVLTLLIAGALAAVLPAWRAAHTDPLIALRAE